MAGGTPPTSPSGESRSRGPSVLQLAGAVDVRVARRLHQTVREHANAGVDLVVECAAVERFDASAVQILLALKAALARAGRSLELRSIPASVLSFLSLAGAAKALAIDPGAQGGPAADAAEPTSGQVDLFARGRRDD